MNNKGYAILELVILFAFLGIVFAISISRVTFAYKQASATDTIKEEQDETIKTITKVYAKANKDKFNNDKENYLFGKDLIDAGYLLVLDDMDFSDVKIKVTYQKDKKDYVVEIVE